MRINRGRFFSLPPINPSSNPDIPDNSTSSSYTLADFGENDGSTQEMNHESVIGYIAKETIPDGSLVMKGGSSGNSGTITGIKAVPNQNQFLFGVARQAIANN